MGPDLWGPSFGSLLVMCVAALLLAMPLRWLGVTDTETLLAAGFGIWFVLYVVLLTASQGKRDQ